MMKQFLFIFMLLFFMCSPAHGFLFGDTSGLQPLDSTLTDIADGTINENLVNTANPWADNEVAGDITLDSMKLKLLTSEESVPVIGIPIYVDNVTFDPSDVPGDDPYYAMLTRDTTELMPNAIDRNFTGGATAWADVDLGGGFNETTDLTITATAANQYCTCPVDSAPTTVGKRYRMTYDLANIVSTWTLKSFDGTQTIGTISANASQGYLDWTATTTGGYRIVATSTTSSGDFDNFTLNELPYVAIMDENGSLFTASIGVPTLEEDELNDNAGDRLLTVAELKGKKISNKGVGAAFHLDFPVHGTDDTWNVNIIKEEDQNYTLDPNGSEQWWFKNDNSAFSQLAAGENIVNTTNGRSILCIFSTEDGVYAIGDANWAEETP